MAMLNVPRAVLHQGDSIASPSFEHVPTYRPVSTVRPSRRSRVLWFGLLYCGSIAAFGVLTTAVRMLMALA